ncbi:MAG: carboxymuconolactone decarboxylase family protein [Planctomycetes bacterium]|nr:carboxymuconolactone decarboxylase family protein [Planctomycetota bacterium]
MKALETYAASFPDAAKDIRMNLRAVLSDSTLAPRARWLVALTSAHVLADDALRDAILSDGAEVLDDAARDDAQAACALMAMNNVYYRFRHMVGKAEYERLPARLRMTRLAAPKTSKAEFELASLAASAITGCEQCVRAHEHSVVELGLSMEQVHDAVRIAAVLHAARASRRLAPVAAS